MREYHCTTCDFHITGPADEVADEIDAHEEQHHTDAAAKVEITPEILRAVSDWVFDTALPASVAHALADAARQMEREQADEKRIDELADVFSRAAFPGEDRTHEPNDALRRGVRAVLEEYDPEQRLTAPKPYDQGGHIIQPEPVLSTQQKASFEHLADATSGHIAGVIDGNTYGDPGADPAAEWDRTPRQWDNLRDVPADVLAVCTNEGDANRDSTAPHGWRWINNTPVSEYSLTQFAPYTEIPGGDR